MELDGSVEASRHETAANHLTPEQKEKLLYKSVTSFTFESGAIFNEEIYF